MYFKFAMPLFLQLFNTYLNLNIFLLAHQKGYKTLDTELS